MDTYKTPKPAQNSTKQHKTAQNSTKQHKPQDFRSIAWHKPTKIHKTQFQPFLDNTNQAQTF